MRFPKICKVFPFLSKYYFTLLLVLQDSINIARFGALPMTLAFIVSALIHGIMAVIIFADTISRVRLTIYSIVVWSTMVLFHFLFIALRVQWEASDGQDYLMLVLFYTYTMLPVSMRVSALMAVVLSLIHLITVPSVASVNVNSQSSIILREVCGYLLPYLSNL